MSKKLAAELSIEFVPLPPERRAAWEYAMRIISEYMEKARLELETEQATTQPKQILSEFVMQGSIEDYHVTALCG